MTTGTITLRGDDPLRAVAPTFANFLAVSHVGTEVQLEFIYLDINVIAQQIDKVKQEGAPAHVKLQGKTVAKLVMPISSFLQLKAHLLQMFETLEGSGDEGQPKKETRKRSHGR